MPDNILFYFVFLSQILLISFYYPRKMLNRIGVVLETYPPSKYPRLYTKSIEYHQKAQRNYKIINQIILVVGFILIFAVGYWDYSSDGNIAELFPWGYFMVQMLLLILMEVYGFAYFRLMRKADLRTSRKAELHPRRLFGFISPIIVAVAIFLYIACILFYYYIHQFQFQMSNDTFVISIALTASNILFAGIIFWNLYGKKLDPYQASKDRIRQMGVTVKSLVFMSIGMSIFLMIVEGIDEFDLDYLEPSIMSLYLQFTVLIGLGAALRTLRIENINFDVYKDDPVVT